MHYSDTELFTRMNTETCIVLLMSRCVVDRANVCSKSERTLFIAVRGEVLATVFKLVCKLQLSTASAFTQSIPFNMIPRTTPSPDRTPELTFRT